MTTNGLLDEISGVTAQRVRAAGTCKQYARDEFIFHAGDKPGAVHILEDGLLRVDRTTPSGKQVLLTLVRPGDLCGELSVIDQSRRSASCSVVTDANILSLSSASFRALLAAEPELANAVTRRVVRRMRAMTDQLVAASALDARERIAARILELCEIAGETRNGTVEIALPISQQDIAQWAGLSREAAVKGLRALRHGNIIVTGRQRITVLAPEALEQLGRLARL